MNITEALTFIFTREHKSMSDYQRTYLSVVLDASRWISALIVVFGHILHMVFNDQDPGIRIHWWSYSLWLVSNTNHLAVMVFFVLSGYLVGGGVFKTVRAETFSWRIYLVNRISRLGSVLVIALMLGGLFDLIGSHFFNLNGLYDGRAVFPLVSYSIVDHLGLRDLLVNAIFCQRILGEHFGSNGPLWSLAYEFWYYLACPLFAYIVLGRTMYRRILSGFVLLGLTIFVGEQISLYFLVWLIGAALPSLSWKSIAPWGWWCAALVIYMMLAGNGFLDPLINHFPIGRLRGLVQDMGAALLFAGMILAVQNRSHQVVTLKSAVFHQRLANFSYSLYLTHFPFVLLACAMAQTWCGEGLQSPMSVRLLMWSLFLLLITYMYALGVAWCVEFRTPAIRAWLMQRFAPRSF